MFTYPAFYQYPPSYTLQPVAATRQKQLGLWSALILSWCEHHNVHWLERNSPLFRNEQIGRALPPEAVDAVLGAVVARGDGEWDATRARVLVYWRKPADWGALIWGWIEATGQNGSVLTVHEIRHGISSKGQPFYALELDAMLRALQALETDGKCALMEGEQGDALGVKFAN